jgi:ribosome recycling factor
MEAVKQRMEKAIDSLHHDLKAIRSGRANASMLDTVMVEAYGQSMPLKQVAGVSTPDPKTIAVQPWDKSIIAEIEKGIMTADMGFTPMNDGNMIRIPIPDLSEERREEMKKTVRHRGEEAKIAIRNIRRDENDAVKERLKNKEIGEDDEKRQLDHIQEVTDKYVHQVDEIVNAKEAELSEI